MPGPPQGQGQTSHQPARDATLKGKERSEAGGNPERPSKAGGRRPRVLRSWRLSVPRSPDELLPFLPPLLLLKRLSMAPSVVHGSALDIKLKC